MARISIFSGFQTPPHPGSLGDIRTAGMAIILRIVSSGTYGFSHAYCVTFLSACAKMNALSLSFNRKKKENNKVP